MSRWRDLVARGWDPWDYPENLENFKEKYMAALCGRKWEPMPDSSAPCPLNHPPAKQVRVGETEWFCGDCNPLALHYLHQWQRCQNEGLRLAHERDCLRAACETALGALKSYECGNTSPALAAKVVPMVIRALLEESDG